jgi:CHASE2 domain-containing sensor protein
VIDRLRCAGAGSVVFDVDFSSRSDPAGDRAMASALTRALGLVALPTFGESAGSTDQRTIDALPIPLFRPYAALASVSIAPDADGQVRNMPMGPITAGTPRPSLCAYIAQRSGEADVEFPIDMSINPASIPRLSFIDVRDGKFDPARVRGQSILIGATAVEMGDRYGTPTWDVVPGVIVQAMAAETLLGGVPTSGGSAIPLIMATMAITFIVRLRSGTLIFATTVGALLVGFVASLAAQRLLLISYPLAGAFGSILLSGIICGARETSTGSVSSEQSMRRPAFPT